MYKLTVLGNGPGCLPLQEGNLPVVRFNLPVEVPMMRHEIRICNRKMTGVSSNAPSLIFCCESFSPDWRDQLQNELGASASALAIALDCLPTVGLVSVHALLSLGCSLRLHRMSLRPEMFRPHNMPPRKPLASAFHNWLGERRLAWIWLKTMRTRLDWPDLMLQADPSRDDSVCPDPYPALIKCFKSAAGQPSCNLDDSLRDLVKLPHEAWCRYATVNNLSSLEQYFFIKRNSSITANWWLYSNDLSYYIDTLLGHLMSAQQHLGHKQVLC